MSFFEQEEYSAADIQRLIDSQAEESVHLEFKDGRSLEKSDKKTTEIAKDVSAFANSDGGIIVYGLTEKEHKASSLSYVDGDEYTKEWLEQIINSKINRRIEGIRIYPVRFEGDTKKTVYLVKIPRSTSAPHMSHDKKYYRRFNFVAVPMEEFEVRDLFYRVNKSALVIDQIFIHRDEHHDDEDSIGIELFTSIGNDSTVTETVYKVNYYLTASDGLLTDTIYWNPHKDTINYSHWENGMKVSAMGTMPIFPGEQMDFGRFTIKVNRSDLVSFIDNTTIRVLLLFTGGSSEATFSLKGYYDRLNLNHSKEH